MGAHDEVGDNVVQLGRRKCPKCGRRLRMPLGVFSATVRCPGCDSSVGMNVMCEGTSLVWPGDEDDGGDSNG